MKIKKGGRIWDNRTFLVDLPEEIQDILERGYSKPRTLISVENGRIVIQAVIAVCHSCFEERERYHAEETKGDL